MTTIRMIEQRLSEYPHTTKIEEWNALKETLQEVTLNALARANFFRIAAFHGGTCLRIVHGINRFSEDLDFCLLTPSDDFRWDPFLRELQMEFKAYGAQLDVQDRSNAESKVKKAFLKEDSFGKVLSLTYRRTKADEQKIRIKLEVDTNPPNGATQEIQLIDFPEAYTILTHDRPSLFSGKCHALLARSYVKGRDWYDFIWFVSKTTNINWELLTNALMQSGPWEGQQIQVDITWLTTALRQKISDINWRAAREDVQRFIQGRGRQSIELWNEDFFEHYISKLESHLS